MASACRCFLVLVQMSMNVLQDLINACRQPVVGFVTMLLKARTAAPVAKGTVATESFLDRRLQTRQEQTAQVTVRINTSNPITS